MHDEEGLKRKLQAIESLFAGATTDGEREAAERARDRIAARLAEVSAETTVEWQFSPDALTHRLLVALLRRHGLRPYRHRGQRRTTVVVRATETFIKGTFLPEYEAMAKMLHEHLIQVTDQVVAEVLGVDKSEPAIVEAEPKQAEAFVMPATSLKGK